MVKPLMAVTKLVPQIAIALLGPGFPALMVAILFPKAKFHLGGKLKPINPFRTFPGIEMGDNQPQRATMLRRQGFTKQGMGEKVFLSQEII